MVIDYFDTQSDPKVFKQQSNQLLNVVVDYLEPQRLLSVETDLGN